MKIAFLGDIMTGVHRVVLAPEISERLAHSDIVIGNLEGPVTDAPARPDKTGALHMNDNITILLKAIARPLLLVLANNHVMDHGMQGLKDTVAFLDRLSVPHAGAGSNLQSALEPAFMTVGDYRVCLVAFCHDEGPMAGPHQPGPAPLPDEALLRKLLHGLKRKCDILIVSYHGGEEFITTPWRHRRELFRLIVDCGADIVYGQHAHVLQGFETIGASPVLYGVGNFFMHTPYQQQNSESALGAIFEVEYDADNGADISCVPLCADYTKHAVASAGRREAEIISDVIERSRRSLSDNAFCVQEWNQQAYQRFRGKYGLPGNIWRMYRYCLKKRHIFKRRLNFTEQRDRDILVGAFCHIKHNFKSGFGNAGR